ncbi:MAG: hypothetical protein OEY28_09300, partial [Nitrospira sp.]|nr:hypothetical protein [Nitrospira sp.]
PFSVPVTIASGSFADVWVILTIAPSTTRQQPDQFETRVSDVAAVDCDAPTVAIGSPVPKSGRVSSIVFSITSVTPDSLSQFSDITITGEGFTPPVRVYLNGMLVTDPVAGAEVNAAHTEIINIPVPHIDGAEENGVVVEVETALIEPQDAGVLLSYRFVEWPGGCAGDCCAAQMRTFGGRAGVVLLLVTIMVIASRRRRSSRGHRP